MDSYIVAGKEVGGMGSTPDDIELTRLAFRSNNSRSRAFILLLAACKPRNITNGAAIDTAEALSIFNKKQFHHIFPKAHLDRGDDSSNKNSLMNICMLAASENNWISDQDPHDYIPSLIVSLGGEAVSVFSSNLLPDPNQTDYSTISFDDFLRLRVALVKPVVQRLCAGLAA
jgi:hypothetical protein